MSPVSSSPTPIGAESAGAMNLYWVYDLPTWLFAVLTIGVTVTIGLIGLYSTRKWVRRIHVHEHSHNEVVGYYLGATCVFYGITLGLLAVATWQNYTDVETRTGEEAAAAGVLFRDVSGFPEPYRTTLQSDIRAYTRQVVDVAWPLQRKGIIPEIEGKVLNQVEQHLMTFEPQTEGLKALYNNAYAGFNRLADLRGRRLQSVRAGLAAPLWVVIFAGAFLSIALTWFFDMKSQSMHFWMTVMLATLLGLLIFMLGALDNPFRGEISVSSEPFELVYQRRMMSATNGHE
jgi:hypothetical protein